MKFYMVPFAKRQKKTLKIGENEKTDYYYWLRDDNRENKEVLDYLNAERINLAEYLSSEINKIDGLKHVKYDFVKHVYYVFAFSFDEEKIGISRNKFCESLNAEGIPCGAGYVKPLYMNPLYLEKRS